MELPCLIGSELRQASRNLRTYRNRLIAGILTGLLGFLFIFLGAIDIGIVVKGNRDVFWWLSALIALYGGFIAVFLTGDTIAGERREGTLQLLCLTHIGMVDIMLGKLIVAGIGAAQVALAFLPALALVFTVGGVTMGEFVRVGFFIGNTLFLSLGAGLFASTLLRDGRRAVILGFWLLAVMVVLPPLVNQSILIGPYRPAIGDLFSPAATFRSCRIEAGLPTGGVYYSSLLLQHLIAWGFLLAAGIFLGKNWQKPDLGKTRAGFVKQIKRPRKKSSDRQDRFEDNPFFRLQSYGYGISTRMKFGWALGSLAVLGFVLTTGTGTGWIGIGVLVVCAGHVLLKLWIAWAATQHMVEMRRSGMLELVLTAPMDWRLLLEGSLVSLKKAFLLPLTVMFSVQLIVLAVVDPMAMGALRGSLLLAIPLFTALDMFALAWYGMYQGVMSSSLTRAWFNAIGAVLLIPWCMVCVFLVILVMLGVPAIFHVVFMLLLRWFFGMAVGLAVSVWAIDRLRNSVRESLSNRQG